MMDKQELIEKCAQLDDFFWNNPKGSKDMREWDNYSDEILGRVEYWANLDQDSLWMAYKHGVAMVSNIDPEYAEKTCK